jgi:hypothetical protein
VAERYLVRRVWRKFYVSTKSTCSGVIQIWRSGCSAHNRRLQQSSNVSLLPSTIRFPSGAQLQAYSYAFTCFVAIDPSGLSDESLQISLSVANVLKTNDEVQRSPDEALKNAMSIVGARG